MQYSAFSVRLYVIAAQDFPRSSERMSKQNGQQRSPAFLVSDPGDATAVVSLWLLMLDLGVRSAIVTDSGVAGELVSGKAMEYGVLGVAVTNWASSDEYVLA